MCVAQSKLPIGLGGDSHGGNKYPCGCLRGELHAKEFLPGGVPYDPNPRELFRGLTA